MKTLTRLLVLLLWLPMLAVAGITIPFNQANVSITGGSFGPFSISADGKRIYQTGSGDNGVTSLQTTSFYAIGPISLNGYIDNYASMFWHAAEADTLGSYIGTYRASPVITSGFGTSPTITATNTEQFEVVVGSGGTASSGVITMPFTPGHAFMCTINDITTTSASVFITKVTGESGAALTITNFSTSAAASPWIAGDHLQFFCRGY